MAHLVSRKATHNALLLFLDHASMLFSTFQVTQSSRTMGKVTVKMIESKADLIKFEQKDSIALLHVLDPWSESEFFTIAQVFGNDDILATFT